MRSLIIYSMTSALCSRSQQTISCTLAAAFSDDCLHHTEVMSLWQSEHQLMKLTTDTAVLGTLRERHVDHAHKGTEQPHCSQDLIWLSAQSAHQIC